MIQSITIQTPYPTWISKNHLLNGKTNTLSWGIATHCCTVLSSNTKERKFKNNNNYYGTVTKSNYSSQAACVIWKLAPCKQVNNFITHFLYITMKILRSNLIHNRCDCDNVYIYILVLIYVYKLEKYVNKVTVIVNYLFIQRLHPTRK